MQSTPLVVTPSLDRAALAAFGGLAAGLAMGLGAYALGTGPTLVTSSSVVGALAVGLALLRWRLSNVVTPHGVRIGTRWIPADTVQAVEIDQRSQRVGGSFRTGMRPAPVPALAVVIRADAGVFVLLEPRQDRRLALHIGERAASLLCVPIKRFSE